MYRRRQDRTLRIATRLVPALAASMLLGACAEGLDGTTATTTFSRADRGAAVPAPSDADGEGPVRDDGSSGDGANDREEYAEGQDEEYVEERDEEYAEGRGEDDAEGRDEAYDDDYAEGDDDGYGRAAAAADVYRTPIGDVYTYGPDKLSLYTYARDEEHRSRCEGSCTSTWTAAYAEKRYVQKDGYDRFSTFEREDGRYQWALDKRPLYRYGGDAAAGEANGNGRGGVWYVARPYPVTVEEGRFVGAGTVYYGSGEASVRTDYTGHTVYEFDYDGENSSNCYESCAANWPPVHADKGAVTGGRYDIIERRDGTYQYTYDGRPLYFYYGDNAPGESYGDGEYEQWWIARP